MSPLPFRATMPEVMRAVRYDALGEMPYVTQVPSPSADPGWVVVRVEATGLCRSDWHGWQGHDPALTSLPHIPGHEFSGTVSDVGLGVQKFAVGDRVVVPFVCGCGQCEVCRAGAPHVCPHQYQPGFSGPGTFAEFVAIPAADHNVVHLPEEVSFEVAAGLGCRFATAFRAVVDVADVQPGEMVAVFGCGGVGLAAVMVAHACGAEVIAVDVSPEALQLAWDVGGDLCLDSSEGGVVEKIRRHSGHGVDVTIDAFGSVGTARACVESLRVQGRHVQVGLLPDASVGDRATVPMSLVIARELRVLGSHGMPVADYPRMLETIARGRLDPATFLRRQITLEEVPEALVAMSERTEPGVTIIRPWA